MHLLKDSWQFSFIITEKATRISFEKPQFTCETHYACGGYNLLVYSAFLWPAFKKSAWHIFRQFLQVTTILSRGQPYVRYKPALRVRSAIFAITA